MIEPKVGDLFTTTGTEYRRTVRVTGFRELNGRSYALCVNVNNGIHTQILANYLVERWERDDVSPSNPDQPKP